LALGILNFIIQNGLYDKDFVNKWCIGFEKLEDHIQQYSAKKVAEITWLREEKINKAAAM
jgi:anaerobic selenocysteine-containing dehydrogenase